MTIIRSLFLLSTFCLAVQPCVTKAVPFDSLSSKVPAGANTLVLIDVEAALATPVAEEAGWGKKLELAYVDRPIFLPPEASKIVVAGLLQPNDNFSRLWELAIMDLSEPMSMRSIARSEGGYVDQVNGIVSAWTPSNAYFVSLSETILGVIFPAERQFVSRWIDFAQGNSENRLSSYLQSAAKLATDRVPIMLAIDLRDVVRPHEVEAKIEGSDLLKGSGLSTSDFAEILTSLQGATLRVAVGKDVQGQLRVDFSKSVAPIKSIAKELVLKVLDDLEAPVDDLADWKLELEDRAITMRGPLSKDGQRRIFSILEIPSTKFSTLKEEGNPEVSQQASESKVREASLTYYRSTEVLLKDLQRDMRGNKAVAAVMERYARKIDRMPILNVDDELLDYGSQLASTLRGVALAKRGGGIKAGTQTAGMGAGRQVDTSYNEYGYTMSGDRLYSARESAADRASIKANAMAGYKNARVEGAKQVAERSAAIRRQMTQKYGVEF